VWGSVTTLFRRRRSRLGHEEGDLRKCADAFREGWSCVGRAVHKELGDAFWLWDLAAPRLTSYLELTGSCSLQTCLLSALIRLMRRKSTIISSAGRAWIDILEQVGSRLTYSSGGTSGCVIAGRLAEDINAKILVLEAGPDNADLENVHMAGG
jgi:hypothetical protein